MKSLRIWLAAAVIAVAGVTSAAADVFLGSYEARISNNDHFASDGYRLDTAPQVVRQDRANFHKFGQADAEDQNDNWYGSVNARARFQKLLGRRGAMNSATRNAIMNGEPLIEVEVYRNSVRVRIISY